MRSEKSALVFLFLQLFCAGCGFCGKVLVWPCDMSHWLNVKVILEELIVRGHEVTVLTHSKSFLIDYRKPSALKFEVVHMPQDKTENKETFVDLALNVLPGLSTWQSVIKLNDFFVEIRGTLKMMCESFIYNQTLMKKLQETNYDVMLIDPVIPCGDLMAELLAVPFVVTLRTSLGGNMERSCGKLPAPLSYVPVPMTRLTDRMTFLERVKNSMLSVFFHFWIQDYDYDFWKEFYSKALGRPTTLCETVGKAEIWLIRTYWDFEYPQPYQPNFEFVGGLHCKPAKPLPKVLWRYKGKKPSTLGTNTRLYDWIPQNDLLGHPQTKAFITHGGMNGVYEAIYHGVPMVGVPIFGDQPDNIAHMKAKGAAVEINFKTMTSEDLLRAVRTVITDSSYKENAMRLSRIHHDQSVKPLDRAVFWIEFVMRHKGAKHLRSAAHDLNWFQHHSIDVIAFLLACVATAIFLFTRCFLFSCQNFNKTRKIEKRE
uniref:UDP-glucuronosyltransferase n=1 Tax=Macaca mulatta TaxID=9544 RepID=A0A5F8AFM8_MACMU